MTVGTRTWDHARGRKFRPGGVLWWSSRVSSARGNCRPGQSASANAGAERAQVSAGDTLCAAVQRRRLDRGHHRASAVDLERLDRVIDQDV